MGRRRLVRRLDAAQRRHPALGFPIAVLYKFVDDQGMYLASLITHYAFLSVFPLLLLATTILGFILQGHPHLQEEVVNSALGQFPVIGQQLKDATHPLVGSAAAVAVGIIGSLYGGLGMAQALQNALNRVWAVPRRARPNPLRARVRSLGLLGVLGGAVLVTTALSAITTGAATLGHEWGTVSTVGAAIAALALNVAVFLVAFRVLCARDLAWRVLLLGAVVAGVGWQSLQLAGTYYLHHKVEGSTQLYGIFGLVLGLIAWLAIESMVIVFAAEINVVRADGLYPRSLGTPFTDHVQLTPADEHAYTAYAQTELFKGFEHIEVTFDEHD
jgi:membrane protein